MHVKAQMYSTILRKFIPSTPFGGAHAVSALRRDVSPLAEGTARSSQHAPRVTVITATGGAAMAWLSADEQ